jgi:single-strand DNA-binding protein
LSCFRFFQVLKCGYFLKHFFMAMSLNRAQLIGNLTRDPELRQIPGGQTVATFSVATNFVWTDSNGQRQEKVEFHNVVAWRKLAEIAGQYLKKGSKVYVEGRIQTRDWEGEDGVKRYRTEIVADSVIMLDRKGAPMEGAEMGNQNFNSGYRKQGSLDASSNPTAAPQTENQVAEDEVAISDLPF